MLEFKRRCRKPVIYGSMPVLFLLGVANWIASTRSPAVAANQARLLTGHEMSAIFGDATDPRMCQKTIPCDTTWKLDPTQQLCTQCVYVQVGDTSTRKVCCPFTDASKSCDSSSAGNSPCANCQYWTTNNSNRACPPVCDGLTNSGNFCTCADYVGGNPC
jgi:hypothetical protein